MLALYILGAIWAALIFGFTLGGKDVHAWIREAEEFWPEMLTAAALWPAILIAVMVYRINRLIKTAAQVKSSESPYVHDRPFCFCPSCVRKARNSDSL